MANQHVVAKRDWATVVGYLYDLKDNQIKLLGGLLGLSAANVGRMKDLPTDMVEAWLQGEEDVAEVCGPDKTPTWEILAQKLKEMRPAQTVIAEKILEEKCQQILRKDHVKITQSIKEVCNEDLVALGEALGLSRPKLLRMRDMPADMVAAWLRQEDNVITTTGDPTWSTLANKLDYVGQGGVAKKIRLAHNIPQPKTIIIAPKRAAPAGPDHHHLLPQPVPPLCVEDEEYIKLKTSLQDHNLHVGNKDRKALLDEGIVSVDSLLYLKGEDLSGVLKKLTFGGRGTLERFWISKQTIAVHEHNPVNGAKKKEEDVQEKKIGQATQETSQPNSTVDVRCKPFESSPTQESRQHNGSAYKQDLPDLGINYIDSKSKDATPSNVPRDQNLEFQDAGLDSDDDNDSEDDAQCDADKASFKSHPQKVNNGKLVYQPKLKLSDKSTDVTKFETDPIVRPGGHDCHPMKSKEHGVALIINNKKFDSERHYECVGFDRDEDNLIETFRFLGYRVKVRRQCKKEKIESLFDKMQRWVKDADDSFVCCILSHGNDNIVYGTDSKGVAIRTAEDSIEMKLSRCKKLLGKPKIFFISTSRGGAKGRGEEQSDGSECPTSIPYRAEFAFYCSTLQGEISMRNPTTGTFYIHELCQVLCEKATTRTLSDIQLEVTDRVRKIVKYYQVPSVDSQMTKNVYFFDDLAPV